VQLVPVQGPELDLVLALDQEQGPVRALGLVQVLEDRQLAVSAPAPRLPRMHRARVREARSEWALVPAWGPVQV
jgi:hypothetical protein